MFGKLKGLKNRLFGKQQQPAPEPAGTEAATPQEDEALAEVEEAQSEAVSEETTDEALEDKAGEVEETAEQIAEQDKAPKTGNALQELGSALENSKTKAHSSIKGFFGKKNSDAYKNVIMAINTCLHTTSGGFSEDARDNKQKIKSAAFASEMLITACKMYLAKNSVGEGPKTEAGRQRIAKVAQILELAKLDYAGMHQMASVLQSMPVSEQKNLSWNKILQDARSKAIEVEDFSALSTIGAGNKTGDKAGRVIGKGVFTKEDKQYDHHVNDDGSTGMGSWFALANYTNYKESLFDEQDRVKTDYTGERNITARNEATSRMANLLGLGNIVANSTTVKVHDKKTDTTYTGNYMDWAEGKEAKKTLLDTSKEIAKQGGAGDDIDKREQMAKAMVTPSLMGQLMNITILDYLCWQVDRHTGNYFVSQNDEGKFDGITGIDNDISFGHSTDYRDDVLKGRQNGVKLARVVEDGMLTVPYMEKTLAENILALKPEELEFALEDLLEPDTIAAARTRLTLLQDAIRNTMSKKPEVFINEWSMDMHDKLMENDGLYRRYKRHKAAGSDAYMKEDQNDVYNEWGFGPENNKQKYDFAKGRNMYSTFMLELMGGRCVAGGQAQFLSVDTMK